MTKEQSSYIKIIAITTMLIDHIGAILLPEYYVLRIIGRIAFPLFAYQIGTGYLHTKSPLRYFLRLVIFGTAIQIAYMSAIPLFDLSEPLYKFNIFFTLALGLASIHFYSKRQYIPLVLNFAFCLIINAAGIEMDYGIYGIAMILLLYALRHSKPAIFISMVLSTFLYCFMRNYYIQMYCLLSLMFILKPISLRWKIPGTAFYVFYPLHLAVLYGISILVS